MAKADHVDELFAVPPSDFVQSRNALARRLRDAGDSAKAREVAGLGRPPVPVWLANQVARRDPESIARFVKAVAELMRAQVGHGDISAAMEHQRRSLEGLVATARGLLKEASIAPSTAVLSRLSATLLGAATDKDQQKDLTRGRLRRELSAPGFDLFASARVRPRPDRSGTRVTSHAPGEHQGEEVTRPETATRAARREAKAKAAARAEAARRVLALRRAAARHRSNSAKAAQKAAALRVRLEQLEGDAAREREAADRAEHEAATQDVGVTI
jgi:hypothetical protein